MIRKRLFGVSSLQRLRPEDYTPEVTGLVYDTIAERALTALKAGHAVIADATCTRSHDREAIEAVARHAGVPFIGLWIEAPPQLLAGRLRERVADASDATVDVLRLQTTSDVGPLAWLRLDGSLDRDSVQRAAESLLARSKVLATA